MKNYLVSLFFIFTTVFLFGQTATGNIEDYVGNIIYNAPGSTGDNYIEPNATQLNTWNTVINFILIEDLINARSNANGLNYQINEFTDISISPNQIFYVLEEKNPQSNYWGTFIFSQTPLRNNLIIQAPHSKFDTNTGKEAIYCFKNTLDKAVFINGTHQCNSSSFSPCSGTTSVCGSSNSYKISDLAHTTTSMFQKTTENLYANISNSVFIQLHGFGKQPTDPYVIMSNGTRETPSSDYAVMIKDALLTEDSSLTFELAHINTSWTRLIGFTNTQGRLINNSSNFCNTSAITTSGRFVHIEQEKLKLRDNELGWEKMSNALVHVFASTLSTDEIGIINKIIVYPNPSLDKVFIQGEHIQYVDVYNLLGQKIKTKNNSLNKNSVVLYFNNSFNKTYFLRIVTPSNSILKKVILR
jgi:hypothetical protein